MAFEQIGDSITWVAEMVNSDGYFLVLNYADASPGFSRDLNEVSKYSSKEVAEMAVDRVHAKGFTMELKVKPLRTTYEIGEGYGETE
jgi:hypothetical protein